MTLDTDRRRWPPLAVRPSDEAGRPRLPRRAELVTVALATWLMVGLFVDGWAHSNLAGLETFFTPWHALFYSGFIATASWIAWQAHHSGVRTGGLAVLPVGYRGALLGVAVFAVGGLGDMTWHVVFGVEQDIAALFSPTHLLLFVGIALIISAPLRAAWSAEPPGGAPSYRAFLPVLASATLVTTLFAFMLMYLAAFATPGASSSMVHWASLRSGATAHWLQTTTLAAVFTTDVLLVAPLLLLVRRWQLPMGTATTLFTTVAVLTGALDEFGTPLVVAAAVPAGLLTDLLVHRLRSSPARPWTVWLLGAVAPLTIWPLWFAAVALSGGLGWSLELWTGTILWTAIFGGTLALLMCPPSGARQPTPTPAEDQPRVR